MRIITYVLASVVAVLLPVPVFSGGKGGKADKVSFEVYAKGYFVKNNAPLPGNPAFLVLTDLKGYDEVFGFGRVIGPLPKTVDAKLFEKNMIVTVIKSGNALTNYAVEQVRRDKDKLIVQYKAMNQPAGSAKYSSPLIVAVPRGDYGEVVFIENGKEAGKVAVKK